MAEEKEIGFRLKIKGTDAEERELQQVALRIQELEIEIKKWNKVKKENGRLTAEQIKRVAQLKTALKGEKNAYRDTEAAILKKNNALRKNSGFVSGIKKGVGDLATSFIGITAIIGGVTAAVSRASKEYLELDEAMADVRKTTGLNSQQVLALADHLKQLDTKTTITDLLGIAEAGGRLNIQGDDLIGFVESVDKAFVALGDTLSGDAGEIGTTLGKIVGAFGDEATFGSGEAISRFGSAINELGANSKANEGFIVNFTNRLTGIAPAAGIASTDIAALGALMDEFAQSPEVAATTFSKLLPAIGKDVEKFAGIAGVDVKDFQKALEEDSFEALKLVAAGAKSTKGGLEGLTETLQNYGIDSARAAGIVGVLSDNTQRLTELQALSAQAFEENNSLTAEFNAKNQTAQAQLDKLGNAWDNFTTSVMTGASTLGAAFSRVIAGVTSTIKQFQLLFSTNTSGLDKLKIGWNLFIQFVADSVLKLAAPLLTLVDIFDTSLSDSIQEQVDKLKFSVDIATPNLEKQNELLEEQASNIDDVNDAITVGTSKTRKQIEAEEELAKKREKEAEKERKRREKAAEKAEKERQKEIIEAQKAMDAIEEATLTAQEREIRAVEKKFERMFELADKFGLDSSELLVKQGEELQAIRDAQQQKEEEKAEEARQKLLAKRAEDVQLMFDIGETFFGGLRDLSLQTLDLELQDFDRAAEAKLDSFKGSESDKKKLEEQLDAEREVIERKAFERQKKFALAEVAISLARELASIQAAAAANPANAFTFGGAGISQAAVLSGLAIANAAIQTALIARQKFAKGGIIDGPSHSEGGVPILGGTAEVEGGEGIINKRSMASGDMLTLSGTPKEIASAINSYKGYGDSFAGPRRFMQRGGVAPSTSSQRNKSAMNMDQLAELIVASQRGAMQTLTVVNNATDTLAVAADAIQTEQSLSF